MLRETFCLVFLGISLGIPTAIAAIRILSSLLYDTGGQSYLAVGVAVVVMVTTAAIGACVPARYASRADPLLALRTE